jgi:hypothetical protein
MATHRWSRRIQFSVAALAVIAASCTDAPVVPEAAKVSEAKPSSYYSTYGGSEVTIVDEDDGQRYTLNTATREITRGSDGAVLLLNSEQTALAATAFYGDLVADAVLNSFMNVCSPENPCGDAMSGSLSESTTLQSGIVLTKESEGPRTHRGSKFGTSFSNDTRAKQFRSSSNTIDLMYGDVCSDIVNAVFQSRLDYRTYRTNFLKDAFTYAAFVAIGGATRRIMPIGGLAAVRFTEKIAAGQERRIAVSILGWMWNSNYCGNGQAVTAGPVIRGFGGSGGNANNLVCHDETWSISFDGGNRFVRITVEVCEYMQS